MEDNLGTPRQTMNATAESTPDRQQRTQRRQSTRGKTGCSTCRQRRKKCGEEQPQCINCQRLGLECRGQESLQLYKSYSTTHGSASAVFVLRSGSLNREQSSSMTFVQFASDGSPLSCQAVSANIEYRRTNSPIITPIPSFRRKFFSNGKTSAFVQQ